MMRLGKPFQSPFEDNLLFHIKTKVSADINGKDAFQSPFEDNLLFHWLSLPIYSFLWFLVSIPFRG